MKRSSSSSLLSGPTSSSADKKPRVSSIAALTNTIKTLTREELVTTCSVLRMEERTQEMVKRAEGSIPFTDQELDDAVHSLQQLTPQKYFSVEEKDSYWMESRRVLKNIAHISHKNWAITSSNAQQMLPFWISKQGDFPALLDTARYNRILTDGNWLGAVKHASSFTSQHPWAVLVTGVNGIRKTTSLYQPWFASLLQEALIPPNNCAQTNTDDYRDLSTLPTGKNSFFRQLDHIIATLCNQDFAILYALTEKNLAADGTGHKQGKGTATLRSGDEDLEKVLLPSLEQIQAYSNLKAAIFSRFRTLSELLGVLLLQQAQKVRANCLLETSGRDVAMFHYVDHIFPNNYRKLALHFVIDDLTQAQTSVDRRMVNEIRAGIQAIQGDGGIDVSKVVCANAGGPYGSEVLPGVQEASDRVWKTVVDGTAGVGDDWFKATILIKAYSENTSQPWSAQAVKPDGSLGTCYTFEPSLSAP